MSKFLRKVLVYLITAYIIISPVTPAVQVVYANNRQTETGSEVTEENTTDTGQILGETTITNQTTSNSSNGNTHTLEVCFVNLDEKGRTLDNLPRAVEFEFPIYTNPNVNKNTGLPDAYVESGSELNNSNTVKFNVDEETGNNETIWNNSGKNDAYCETHEIKVPIDTERRTYAYGEMTIIDPLNDWFDTRYHDGYQSDFSHPNDAERYSSELFTDGDINDRKNLSDGHINLYSANDERRIVVVNKIEKRVLPKTIEVCFVNIDSEGNFVDGNYLGNGTNFEIDLYADLIEGENGLPEENRSRVYETVKLRTPFSNNADIFNTGEQTGFCKEVEFVTKNKNIGYSTVSINSNYSIKTPLYSDQHTGYLNNISYFNNYSNELFDGIKGNENDRNKDSDGHIVIPENGNPRRLVILNSLNQNSFIGEINVVDKYGDDIDGHEHDFYDENVEYLNEESNNSTKYLTYKIKDNDPTQIKHVRFSWDGFNWGPSASLPYETNCRQSNLDNAVEVTSCNAWNGEEFQEWLFPFEEERKETRFMEITDSAGNVRIVTKDIVFDMTPPDNKIIFVQGERQYDSSNPTTLFDLENNKKSWLTYHIKDGTNSARTPGQKLSDSEVSGAYKIRFMQDGVDNNEWTNWEDYTNDKIETRLLAWNELINRECDDEDRNCSENLFVSGQTMDRAGNVSGIFNDSMDYYRPREDKLDISPDARTVGSTSDKAFFEFNLKVDSDQSWTFDLVDAEIPIPDITEISLDDTNTVASLSGFAFPKEYDIQVNVTETVKTNPWCVAFCAYEDKVYPINEEHSFTDHWMRYYKFDFASNEENDHQVGDKYIYNDGTFDADIWIHPDNNLTLGNIVYGKATLEGWFELELENHDIKPFYDFTGDNRFFSESSNLVVFSSTQDNQFIGDVEGSDDKDNAPVKLHGLDLEGMDDISDLNIFYDYIKNLIEDGIVNGYSTGKFEPDNFVTRAQMSKFIIKGLDLEDKQCDKQHSFSDVPEGNVFAPYINKMACLGISTGYSDGTYKPDKDIERGEATKLLVNGLNAKHGIDLISEYPLSDDISEYYSDVTNNNVFAKYIGVLSILSVNGESIVKGYSGSAPPPFKPGNQISRGQMAKIIDLARQWYPDAWTKAFSELENSYVNVQRDGVIHDWCGFKVVDYSSIGNYGDSIAFYNPNQDNAYLVTGEIWEYYYSNGGCDTFGAPTGNMWSPDTPCGTNGASQYFEGWQMLTSERGSMSINTSTDFWNTFNNNGNIHVLGWPVFWFDEEQGIEDADWQERVQEVWNQEDEDNWVRAVRFENAMLAFQDNFFADEVFYLPHIYEECPMDYSRFDQTLEFISNEIITNSQSQIALEIQEHLENDEIFIANAKFWNQVRSDADWDHKPQLDNLLELGTDGPYGGGDYFYPIREGGEREYFYDIWSNIHYGFVGSLVGFDAQTLQDRAAGGGLGAGTNDDFDILNVQIGIDIFEDYGEDGFSSQILHSTIIDNIDEYLSIDQEIEESEENNEGPVLENPTNRR